MSALKKIGTYLGFVEDDIDEPHTRHQRSTVETDDHADEYGVEDYDVVEYEEPAAVTPIRASVRPVESAPASAMQRIQTIHPRSYNDAKAIGTAFRDGIPVIMNLSAMDEANSKRLVDFSAGLIFGLRGNIERISSQVFLLCPHNLVVGPEDKQKLATGGFFNQS